MARVVLVCGDPTERTLLQACLKGNDVVSVKTLKDAGKALTEARPDMAILRLDVKDPTGMEVLRLMKRSQIAAATIVVLPRQAGSLKTEAWQLGVRTFLSSPIRYEDFQKAMAEIKKDAGHNNTAMPEVTEAEHQANLSSLVSDLQKEMKCPAGSNRVLIRSVVTGLDKKSEPRVCLRCSIRQAVGLNEYVYYEHIRDCCCGQYKTCEAVIQYKKLRQAKG